MWGATDWIHRLLPSDHASHSLEVLNIELIWWGIDEQNVEEWLSGRDGECVRALGTLIREQRLKHVVVAAFYSSAKFDDHAGELFMQEFEAGFMLHVGSWARENCKIQIQWATYYL